MPRNLTSKLICNNKHLTPEIYVNINVLQIYILPTNEFMEVKLFNSPVLLEETVVTGQ